MTKKSTIVNCPTCGKEVAWVADSLWKPFCSERCKLIDLGEWAMEKYRVPVVEGTPDGGPESGQT